MQFEHFNISAPLAKLETLVEFYTQLFGWKLGFRPAFSRQGFWLYAGELAILHLTESDEHQAAHKPYLDHLAFRGHEPERFLTRLAQMDVEIQQQKVPELNMLQVFFEDPVGTGLEVNFILSENAVR